ncbi:response regulator [Sphingomonas humi]|uniref:Response regulatory domain-containing protein n=1 Tax=Sphingomonas humi TaxID=335630 RepID=A0ABP7S084_9SPHN
MLFGKQVRHVKRILIVEDEPLVAFDNELMVEAAGYTVVATVDSVRDALTMLSRHHEACDPADKECGIDLILTDIGLTGNRSGVDLAREAGKIGIPVLFATAAPPAGAEQLAIGVLLKPYNDRTLKAALKVVEKRLAGKARIKAPDGMILYDEPPLAA